MSKHTKGPWEIVPVESGVFGGGPWHAIKGVQGDRVASVSCANDAHLIAAAPEMLDALKGVVRTLEAFSYTTQLGESQSRRLADAKAVIAKAEGRK